MLAWISCFADCRAGTTVTSFDDIEFWVGSGLSRAALVIDWTDGRDPLVWGYRFNAADQRTGEDLVLAVVSADARLYAKAQIFNFGSPSLFTHGYGYDRDGDGFAINDGTVFDGQGFAINVPFDSALSLDIDDSYIETPATWAANWNYWIGGTAEILTGGTDYVYTNGNPYNGSSWSSAPVGMTDRPLSDGAWDGYIFDPDGLGPQAPVPGLGVAAVPEPQLAWCSIWLYLFYQRRRRRA